MWELIEFINGSAVTIGHYADFTQCKQTADAWTYLNDGMALVICAVTL